MNPPIDLDLLKFVRCPVTRSELTIAPAEILATINEKIQRGDIANRAGQPVREPLSAGLVNTDQSLLWPVRDKIAVLAVDQAIPLTS